jgi:hypothetical protein
MALEERPDLPDWPRQAALAIVELSYEKHLFSADDLRGRIPDAPHSWMVGQAFSAARNAGLIARKGFDVSKSKSRKFGVVRVWTRKINREEKP